MRDPCQACEAVASRRDFLREAASLAACAAALGVIPGRLGGLPLAFGSALRNGAGEAVYPIPQQDGATIDRDHEAILVRYQNRVYVFGLSCPHQKTPLRWEQEERRFRCPKHKSTFEPDGAFVSGRATRNMDRYAVRHDGNTVIADLSTLLQEDKDRDRWVQAVVQL
jgi:nitrite reductase/ring-hydroxylating ferredoxin subunit